MKYLSRTIDDDQSGALALDLPLPAAMKPGACAFVFLNSQASEGLRVRRWRLTKPRVAAIRSVVCVLDKKTSHVDIAPAASNRLSTPVFLERLMSRSRFPAFVLTVGVFAGLPAVAAEQCPPLLNHRFASLQDHTQQSLCQWQGKVLLVVNTASYCGFTSQYDGLEKLYARLKDKGLVVVGFPSNDFGEQEPGSNEEIADFCRLTYGIQFPMFAKASIVGANASPFYSQLAKASGKTPQWNFHKYLIDRSGRQVLSFASRVKPDDPALLARIDEFLGR